MNTFKNIDWHPALEDIIDTVFVQDERMQHESAMYRIMSDTFMNPFEGIEHEYAKIDIELIKRLGGDEEVQCELDAKNVDGTTKDKETRNQTEKSRSYIPGIRKLLFRFPRMSYLDKYQQAMCLRVLLRFSNNEKIITKQEKIELQNYMSLQEKISREQTEFLDFAKSKWNESAKLFMKCPGFVTLKWMIKMRNRIEKLSKYYTECTNVPFSMEKDVEVKFVHCLQKESWSEIKLPEFVQRKLLNVTTKMLCQKFPVRTKCFNKTRFLSVSEDTYCEHVAIETKVDLVISSSGLKCLLNNIDPTYSNSWLIPIVIKSHNGKNVIYVNKRLPPTNATVIQKNTWVYKYILRYYFVNAKHKSRKRAKQNKLDKDAIYSDDSGHKNLLDEHLKITKERICRKKNKFDKAYSDEKSEGECTDSSNNYFEIAEEDKTEKGYLNNDAYGDHNDHNNHDYNRDYDDDNNDDSIDCLKIDKSVSLSSISNAENKSNCSTQDNKIDANPKIKKGQNVSYRLFTISETQSQDYDERKDIQKEYRILIRSKLDGIEILPDGGSYPLILSPKMEHQLEFGAEAASLEEALHEWASLIFKPEASLARVRIEANTAEIIQIERHTAKSLNNEIKRLHNVKTEDSLKILYNLIEKLSVLTPGQYVIQHIPKHGPFAHVYKETKLRKNILDLDKIYESKEFVTLSNTPWPPIDKILTTPWIRYSKRMPAMFNCNQNAMSRKSKKYPRKDDSVWKNLSKEANKKE